MGCGRVEKRAENYWERCEEWVLYYEDDDD